MLEYQTKPKESATEECSCNGSEKRHRIRVSGAVTVAERDNYLF